MLGDWIWSGFLGRYFLVREGGSGWMEHSLGERESDSSKASGAKGRAVPGIFPHTFSLPSYNAAVRYVPQWLSHQQPIAGP